ncbi:MAG: helix-turn-helix transcriptional regulator [Chloroflexota bacterium]
MSIHAQRFKLHAKKIGVLLRAARLSTSKSIKECAEAVGVSKSTYRSYETGKKAPSYPEIEALAYFLDILPNYFRGHETLTEETNGKEERRLDSRFLTIRHRVIGASIHQARKNADLSRAGLSRETGISSSTLKKSEAGERPIPLPELEVIAEALQLPISTFQDEDGPVGRWVNEQLAIQAFFELSPEIQDFIIKPINRPYLELAQRLSEMSVEKLRSVAEGLLDITL